MRVVWCGDDAPGVAVAFKLQIDICNVQRERANGIFIESQSGVTHRWSIVHRGHGHRDSRGVGVRLTVIGPIGESGRTVPVRLRCESSSVAANRYRAVGIVRRGHKAVGKRIAFDIISDQHHSAGRVLCRGQSAIACHRRIVHRPHCDGDGGSV